MFPHCRKHAQRIRQRHARAPDAEPTPCKGANLQGMASGVVGFLLRLPAWRQVLPAPGAEQVTDFCGGTTAVLRAMASGAHQAPAQLQQLDGAGEAAAADGCASLRATKLFFFG